MTVFSPPDSAVTKVLIADDHQLIRDMISSFLSAQPDFWVSVAESYEDAYTVLHESEPFDVVLLDVQMRGMEGIRNVEALVREFPSSSIVIFSGVASDQFVQDALKVGAKGYIPKTLPFRSLLNTIKLVASGESFVPSSFVTQAREEGVAAKFSLSETELSILRMVCAGMANKEIAREIETTEILIKMHMRSICKQLGAKNRTQAAVIALREQMV